MSYIMISLSVVFCKHTWWRLLAFMVCNIFTPGESLDGESSKNERAARQLDQHVMGDPK